MKQFLLMIAMVALVGGCGGKPLISIHVAAERGNIGAVKKHLEAGTDVNAKTPNGGTPLFWAIAHDHKEIVELLIAKGANVNARVLSGKYKGSTPMDYALNND